MWAFDTKPLGRDESLASSETKDNRMVRETHLPARGQNVLYLDGRGQR